MVVYLNCGNLREGLFEFAFCQAKTSKESGFWLLAVFLKCKMHWGKVLLWLLESYKSCDGCFHLLFNRLINYSAIEKIK
jgi:hypothetical protein